MARGVYQGADTMKASRAQSLWDVLQGQKRHTKKQDKQRGNKAIASAFGEILKKIVPGYGHIADVGVDVLSEKYLPMPEYEEEDGSFWGSKQITKYGEQAKLQAELADTSLLESIIGNIGDYVGVGTDEKNSLKGFLDEGGRGGDVADAGGVFSSEGFGTLLGFMENGGRVPKYYGGGSVSKGNPTIANYFSQQGKTLGGSNIQSLAEKLGRK
tara:strand:- start:1308 stop:1946 length:639 start_codon:yes stop_codon:yes gene_type:complete